MNNIRGGMRCCMGWMRLLNGKIENLKRFKSYKSASRKYTGDIYNSIKFGCKQ